MYNINIYSTVFKYIRLDNRICISVAVAIRGNCPSLPPHQGEIRQNVTNEMFTVLT